MSELAILLLAAGRSRRFGAADKLTATLDGRAVVEWVVAAQSALEVLRVAVVGPDGAAAERLEAAGFQLVVNSAPNAGQGCSLALGAQAVAATEAERVLVLLGDMPRVTRALLDRVLAAGDHAAAFGGARAGPPAVFPRRCFAALAALDGDRGARRLLDGAARVAAAPSELVDVDTPSALHALSTSSGMAM